MGYMRNHHPNEYHYSLRTMPLTMTEEHRKDFYCKVVPMNKSGAKKSTGEEDSSDCEALALYARIWAVHQLLQLHQQPFLFPPVGMGIPSSVVSEFFVILVLCKPQKAFLEAAIVSRNVVRAIQCPFLWDSEFWLALTDMSILASLLLSSNSSPLKLAAPWVRRQLAVCYGAAAFFKLNTAFLDFRTSCAPIFVLSLVGVLPMPNIIKLPLLTGILTRIAPISVVIMEAAISVLLWFRQHYKLGIWAALIFHLMIAVTPAPNGVPTFSCVAASRLVLVAGDNGGKAALDALKLYYKQRFGFFYITVATAVAVAPRSSTSGMDPAILLFLILAAHCGLALCTSTTVDARSKMDAPMDSQTRWIGYCLVGLSVAYAFVPPILGLQEIGSNTMFANMRLHGGSNHLLGVPTGLLQYWTSGLSNGGLLQDWFGGGVVRVEYTNSEYLNRLYPGEITTLLDSELRSQLKSTGHVGRQFNPKARRVLGPNSCRGMPYWEDDGTAPFVKYTVPALEFRRLLADAREYAFQNQQPFDLHYTRLYGANGDENWRKRSAGQAVQLIGDDGNGGMTCRFRDERNDIGTWEKCYPQELAHLKPPSAWALKFMLFYPYAILPDNDANDELSPDELLCNY